MKSKANQTSCGYFVGKHDSVSEKAAAAIRTVTAYVNQLVAVSTVCAIQAHMAIGQAIAIVVGFSTSSV